MTLVVTGRSVLGALYANGGEATLDALPAKLGADQDAILRMVQSLSAARLVAAPGPTPHRITLTEAGRKWCAAELEPAPQEEAKPAVQAPPPAAPGRMSLFPENRAAKEVRLRPQERHHDRMKGVDVVRVKPRNPSNPRLPTINGQDAAAEPERRVQPAPAVKENPPPAPPTAPTSVPVVAPPSVAPVKPSVAPAKPSVAPVKETQATAPAKEEAVSPPEMAAQPKQTRKRKSAPKVAAEQDPAGRPISIDRDGFVTHINGKKIF